MRKERANNVIRLEERNKHIIPHSIKVILFNFLILFLSFSSVTATTGGPKKIQFLGFDPADKILYYATTCPGECDEYDLFAYRTTDRTLYHIPAAFSGGGDEGEGLSINLSQFYPVRRAGSKNLLNILSGLQLLNIQQINNSKLKKSGYTADCQIGEHEIFKVNEMYERSSWSLKCRVLKDKRVILESNIQTFSKTSKLSFYCIPEYREIIILVVTHLGIPVETGYEEDVALFIPEPLNIHKISIENFTKSVFQK